jgi:adenosylhomocysteine nucleosidase
VSDLIFDDPCLLFALAREARTFLVEFRPQERFRGAPCWSRFCGPSWLTVLVMVTGMGRERTEAALDWLLGAPRHGGVPYKPKLVLSAGFAGALQDDCRIGDLILANEVAEGAGKVWPTTWPGELPPGEWRPPLRRGRLLCVSTMITDPADKQELGKRHAALAVDMESAAVAARCGRAAVPFGCLRAISDDSRTPLSPYLASIVSSGRVSLPRLAGGLVRSPRFAWELWKVARATGFAARQLSLALGELLTLSLPFGANL